jgi:hypothetical protein
VVALATTAVSAQTSQARSRKTFPFSFLVGDKALPAGTYWVQPTGVGSGILRIAGTEIPKSTVRLSTLLHRNNTGNGNSCSIVTRTNTFFPEIWPTGETDGRQLMKSIVKRRRSENNWPRMFAGSLIK